MKKNGKIKECLYCGTGMYVSKSKSHLQYCSHKCYTEHKSILSLRKQRDTGLKICTYCKKELSISSFSKDKSRYDGLHSTCKDCSSMLRKKYRTSKDGKRVTKNTNLKKLYGITVDEYESMYESQNGVCLICKQKESLMENGLLRSLSVDHDHITDEVRGLLCNACNRGLGLFRDNIDALNNAIEYLKQNSSDDGFLEAV